MNDIKIDPKAISNLAEFKNPADIQFGKTLVPALLKCEYKDGKWGQLEFLPYHKILIDPAAKVLHYAQEIFEGLKSYKNDEDEVFLFRPVENAKRFNKSAVRMGMPELPEDLFINSLHCLVKHSHHTFSKELGDSFYLRPFMFGDEPQLGVKPSSTYQYYLIGGPAGNYFTKPSVKVRIEKESHRASSKGIGTAKTGGNYAASMAANKSTSEQGYDQTLWLDPVYGEFVEELSGMNFFAVIDDVLVTPELNNSILHGITRASLLELAQSFGIKVQEKKISINELMDQIDNGNCTELFASGTASVLTPIECLKLEDRESFVKHPNGLISLKLKDSLQKLQTGRSEDPFEWRQQVTL
jgi:branched-chain amino acid aminotransferase